MKTMQITAVIFMLLVAALTLANDVLVASLAIISAGLVVGAQTMSRKHQGQDDD